MNIKNAKKHLANFPGIVILMTCHALHHSKTIFVMPDGIGEIINIGTYLPAFTRKYNLHNLFIVSKNREEAFNLINVNDFDYILINRYAMKAIHSLIATSLGRHFLQSKDWVVYPMKDYDDIDYSKGFIWNIKDKMGLQYEKPLKPNLINSTSPIKKKNIYLNPYARTISMVDFSFYELLAYKLIGRGYNVYTILGQKSQEAIENTIPIYCNLYEAVRLIEESSGIIGSRSGFMDLVASLNVPVICLYPPIGKYNKFYSFTYLEYPNSVKEFVINGNKEKIITKF